MAETPLLTVKKLEKSYVTPDGTLKALDRVDLTVGRGETVAVVGESGSGKTTLGKLILGVEAPSFGTVTFAGETLTTKRTRAMRRRIQVVQQSPVATLNPRRSIKQAIELPLWVHRLVPARQYVSRVAELLETVELPAEHMNRFPGALSGGQRQRVAIARALGAEPDMIVLDEPTSALDVSVQAKIIRLLADLQGRLGLTYLFITHDLSLVRNIAARVVVMYRGKIVEWGDTARVFRRPLHPYTQMLLSSIPVVSEDEAELKPEWPWEREVTAVAARASSACPFAARCPFAEDPCWSIDPPLEEVESGHRAACHLHTGLLKGPQAGD